MINIKLLEIEDNPKEALNYLERIVNSGSKSGFTDIHTTSQETNPFFCEKYRVKRLWANCEKITSYGELPDFCMSTKDKDFIYIHPDWLCQNNFWGGDYEDGEYVVPTSSSRTVKLLEGSYYLKLHYPGMLGRLYRKLEYPQLISGIELTKILNMVKENSQVPKMFEFMPEPCGKILREGNEEIGFLVRIYPDTLTDCYTIPAFSLFSRDRNKEKDELLLIQILNLKENKEKYFLEEICFPLLDIFFYCAFNEGLIFEMHSQNVLFSFDVNWNVRKIILRDLESVDKDLTIMRMLEKSVNLNSYPYKCISKNDEDYYLRHSFMFDHKLGEYLLDPLVECVSDCFSIDSASLKKKIKDYIHSKYDNKFESFFPKDGCWYKYPNIEIDRATKMRPFIALDNPQYR